MKIAFTIALVAALIIGIWFREGKMIATGEEGQPMYFPARTAQLYKSPWVEIGTGYPMPVLLPRVPFYQLAAGLYQVFNSGWFVQALMLWLVLATGLTGFYFLTLELTSQKSAAWTASLFYFFNLYSFGQVWSRFLYTGLAGWAVTPVFLYGFIKLLRTGRIRYLFLLLVFSFLFSNSYGAPSWIVVVWLPLLLFWLWHRDWKWLLITIIAWALVHSWWIIPYAKLSGSAFSSVNSFQSNWATLGALSKFFALPDVLLLRDRDLFTGSTWGWLSAPPYQLLSILVLLICLVGIISWRKNPLWSFLFALFIIGLFGSKGTSPPFGQSIFYFLFKNFPASAVFRNPFEKFGLVFLLPYAVFFGLGAARLNKFIAIGLASILVWPMFTGALFRPDTRLLVPKFYPAADKYLTAASSGRLFHLPLIPGEGVRYTWGFRGVEPSEFLFTRPSISKILRTEYFDNYYLSLDSYQSHPHFAKALAVMQVDHLIFHRDIRPDYVTEANLDISVDPSAWQNVSPVVRIGDLDIFSLSEAITVDRIYAVTDLVIASDSASLIPAMLTAGFSPQTQAIVTGDTSEYKFTSSRLPRLSTSQLSPTHYQVRIQNATSPYVLILADTYNSFWTARIAAEKIPNHFLINGFANGWYIDQSGDYSIDVKFI